MKIRTCPQCDSEVITDKEYVHICTNHACPWSGWSEHFKEVEEDPNKKKTMDRIVTDYKDLSKEEKKEKIQKEKNSLTEEEKETPMSDAMPKIPHPVNEEPPAADTPATEGPSTDNEKLPSIYQVPYYDDFYNNLFNLQKINKCDIAHNRQDLNKIHSVVALTIIKIYFKIKPADLWNHFKTDIYKPHINSLNQFVNRPTSTKVLEKMIETLDDLKIYIEPNLKLDKKYKNPFGKVNALLCMQIGKAMYEYLLVDQKVDLKDSKATLGEIEDQKDPQLIDLGEQTENRELNEVKKEGYFQGNTCPECGCVILEADTHGHGMGCMMSKKNYKPISDSVPRQPKGDLPDSLCYTHSITKQTPPDLILNFFDDRIKVVKNEIYLLQMKHATKSELLSILDEERARYQEACE